MELPVLQAVHPEDFKSYDTATIRQRFLMEDLSKDNEIRFVYSHYERMITGVARPTTNTLTLETYENLRAGYLHERREMGIINVGRKEWLQLMAKNLTLKKWIVCMQAKE